MEKPESILINPEITDIDWLGWKYSLSINIDPPSTYSVRIEQKGTPDQVILDTDSFGVLRYPQNGTLSVMFDSKENAKQEFAVRVAGIQGGHRSFIISPPHRPKKPPPKITVGHKIKSEGILQISIAFFPDIYYLKGEIVLVTIKLPSGDYIKKIQVGLYEFLKFEGLQWKTGGLGKVVFNGAVIYKFSLAPGKCLFLAFTSTWFIGWVLLGTVFLVTNYYSTLNIPPKKIPNPEYGKRWFAPEHVDNPDFIKFASSKQGSRIIYFTKEKDFIRSLLFIIAILFLILMVDSYQKVKGDST